MKFIFVSFFLLTFSLPSNADFSTFKACTGKTKNHIIKLVQVNKDVLASIEDNKFYKYRAIGNASEGIFQASGKEKSMMLLHSIELSTFMKTRTLSREFMVALILGRPEFRGEEDIIYSYADDFFNSLNCN